MHSPLKMARFELRYSPQALHGRKAAYQYKARANHIGIPSPIADELVAVLS